MRRAPGKEKIGEKKEKLRNAEEYKRGKKALWRKKMEMERRIKLRI